MAVDTGQNDISDDIYIDRRGHEYKLMTHEKRVELRKSYIAHTPRWRRPLVGYLVCLPLIALWAYGLYLLTTMVGAKFFAPASSMVIPVLFIALFWGVGPALLAIAAGAVTLNYFFIDPSERFSFAGWPSLLGTWHELLPFLPFIVSGLIVAIIIAQRERARLHALATEWELQAYAQHLEETNQKLEDANQMKDRFLSIVSHELKTPITTIRGQAQIALRRLAKQADPLPETDILQHSLEKINSQTGRLTLLVDELLDVSSMRTGKIELHKKRYDLRDICKEVVNDLHMMSGRMITLHSSTDPIMVDMDDDRVSQVMVNLINNAVKYSPADGSVEVSVEQRDHKALVEVRDHGIGIARDQLDRIFDTFYRTPDAERSATRGLGLGLAISKDIVTRHDGRIWCESERGKGSRFFVELPLG
jgi:signal transduction histidine kinase